MTLFAQPKPDSGPSGVQTTPQVDPVKSYCQRLSAVLNLTLDSDRQVLQAMHNYRRDWPERFRETAWVDLSFLIDLPLHLDEDSGRTARSNKKLRCHLHLPSPLRSVKAKRTCSAKQPGSTKQQPPSPVGSTQPPMLVDRKVSRLMAHLLENERYKTEGLFRKTGNCTRQKELRRQLMQCPECSLAGYTVHDVASVLKLLLRGLDEPIVSDRMFDLLVAIAELSSSDKVLGRTEAEHQLAKCRQLHALRIFGQLLPDPSATLLSSLLHLLHSVATCEETKMTFDSLGTVFGPVLFCAKSAEAASSLQKLERLNRMSAFLIGNCYQLSAIPRSFAEKLASQYAAAAAAHQLAASPAARSVRFSEAAPATAPVRRCCGAYSQQQRHHQPSHQQLASLQKRLRHRDDWIREESGIMIPQSPPPPPSSLLPLISAATTQSCQASRRHRHRSRLVRRALSSLRLNRRPPPPPQPATVVDAALCLRLRFEEEEAKAAVAFEQNQPLLRPLTDRLPTPMPARKRAAVASSCAEHGADGISSPRRLLFSNSGQLHNQSPELVSLRGHPQLARRLRSSGSLTLSASSSSASSLASRLSTGSLAGKLGILETAL